MSLQQQFKIFAVKHAQESGLLDRVAANGLGGREHDISGNLKPDELPILAKWDDGECRRRLRSCGLKDPAAYDLVAKLLAADPKERKENFRPFNDMEGVLQHPFLKNTSLDHASHEKANREILDELRKSHGSCGYGRRHPPR